MKNNKIEYNCSDEQKEKIKLIANELGFEGNMTKLLKSALIEYIWIKYKNDYDKIKELVRILDA